MGDVRQLGLDAPPDPELFMPYTQWPSNEMALVLRTASEPSSLIPVVKKEIWRVDPDQPVTDIKTMDELVSTEAAGRRFVLQLIGAFAAIALVLAAVGIYGVVSYGTRQRTHEIGIRMALGARGQQILWLVAGQNAKWLLIGITDRRCQCSRFDAAPGGIPLCGSTHRPADLCGCLVAAARGGNDGRLYPRPPGDQG